MVVLDHRALMDFRTRLPQQYDDLQGSGQKSGSKRVGLPCCAITALYLRNTTAWKGTLLLRFLRFALSALASRVVLHVSGKQDPGDAGDLIGQGYSCTIDPTSGNELLKPSRAWTGVEFVFPSIHHGPCAMNQQSPEIAIPPFADTEQ